MAVHRSTQKNHTQGLFYEKLSFFKMNGLKDFPAKTYNYRVAMFSRWTSLRAPWRTSEIRLLPLSYSAKVPNWRTHN